MVSNDSRRATHWPRTIGQVVITLAVYLTALLAINLLITGRAHGQAADMELTAPSRTTLASGRWSVRLGAGGLVAPVYPGSQSFVIIPAPLPDISYRAGLPMLDTIYINGRDGLGLVLWRGGPLSFGGAVGYAVGRWQNWAPRLNGLGDINPAVRGSLFLRADFGGLGFSLQGDRAFGNQNGTTVTFEASYRRRLTSRVMVIGLVGTTWADNNNMQQWFGVDPLQASNTNYAIYQPGAGFRSISASLSGVFALSSAWNVNATVGFSQLLGNAAASPIVETPTQPFGLLGLSYKF
ncbi:MipA/OmpV family protein [Reyranella sp.]|uniref:MipA/OmpV family protein n=1 Tax=Reyranella sp. TaxID=1929291 RepID=UPI0025EBD21E|nr:MipA/OmpV family protein [Reyranella sp.]